MKKVVKVLLLGLSTVSLFSCTNKKVDISKVNFKVIVPEGAPSLGLANFINQYKDKCEVCSGGDPVKAAIISKSHDIVVAPVNLGATLYNAGKSEYQLYETIVWGNLYLASTKEISSFADLDNKAITCFQKNSTPDVVLQTIVKYYNLNVEISYAEDVASANTALMTGKAEYTITAEPSLSKLKTNKTIYTINLQDEYKKATGCDYYPQAAIFVNKNKASELKDVLTSMKDSVNKTVKDPNGTAKNAVAISKTFENIGEEILTSAIPNCTFKTVDNQKELVETYFTKMSEIGLSANYGNKLPDEAFYCKL